jgi:translocator protein
MNKRRLMIVAAALLMLVINLLANILKYNNYSTGQISDMFPVFFVPAGYVFSIWGLIYLGIIAYLVYDFKFSRKKDEEHLREIAEWFVIGSLANSIWLLLWHYLYIPSSIFMMVLLLVTLIGIYLEIKKIKNLDKYLFWMVKIPFSIYLGWISVATIANVTVVLYVLGFNGGMYATWWAAAMIIVAGILGLIFLKREKDFAFNGVIVWALIGIAVKFSVVNEIFWAVIVAVSAILIYGALIIAKEYKKRPK